MRGYTCTGGSHKPEMGFNNSGKTLFISRLEINIK